MPRISIETDDRKFLNEFFGRANISSGESYVIPGTNATIQYIGNPRRRAVVPPDTINFMLSFGTGAASGIIANWLYDKLTGKAKSLIIENTKVSIEIDTIKIEIQKQMKEDSY